MTATIVTSESQLTIKARTNDKLVSKLADKGVIIDCVDVLLLSMKKGYTNLDNGWKIKISA